MPPLPDVRAAAGAVSRLHDVRTLPRCASSSAIASTCWPHCPSSRFPPSSPRPPTTSASTTAPTTTRCPAANTWRGRAHGSRRPRGSWRPTGRSSSTSAPSRPTRGRRWTSPRRRAAHLQLQNTIHWIKSIAIEKEAAGSAAALDRDIAVGHYKPINSPRFLNDCHEFIFHFTPGGRTRSTAAPSVCPTRTPATSRAGRPAAATCAAAATPGSSPTTRSRTATRTARIRPRSRRGYPSTVSGCTACRVSNGARSVPGPGQHRRRLRAAGRRFRGRRDRRALSHRVSRADAKGP